MAVLRRAKKDNYTVIDNSVFLNYELSYKAKGLLCQMLSLPDGWSFSIEGLAKLSADGRDSVANTLKELENAGYLRREQNRNGGKLAGIEYIVTDIPFTEKPYTGKPITENPTQLNTKESSTKESNTNKSNNKRFTPPTIEEVQEYINERGSSVDAEAFIDYYASQKWKKANGRPVEDWKACVRTWERNGYDTGRSNQKLGRVSAGSGFDHGAIKGSTTELPPIRFAVSENDG